MTAEPDASSAPTPAPGPGEIGQLQLDADGVLVAADETFCDRIGASRDDVVGRRLAEIGDAGTADVAQGAVARLLASGHLRHRDLALVSRDGTRVHAEFRRLSQSESITVVECRFVGEGEAPADKPPSRVRPGSALPFGEIPVIAEREIERTRQGGQPLSLLSIRIDRIELLENAGADVAEAALHGFAQACFRLLRATDIVGHVDGSCFVALLPDTFAKGALSAAERLRTAVAASEMPVANGRRQRLTVSIGVVTTRTGRTTYAALRSRADAKREDARSVGGNRVNA